MSSSSMHTDPFQDEHDRPITPLAPPSRPLGLAPYADSPFDSPRTSASYYGVGGAGGSSGPGANSGQLPYAQSSAADSVTGSTAFIAGAAGTTTATAGGTGALGATSDIMPIAHEREHRDVQASLLARNHDQYYGPNEKVVSGSAPLGMRRRRSGRWVWVLGSFAVVAVVVLAVILPVYFTVIKPHQRKSSGGSSSGGAGGSGGSSGGSGGGSTGGSGGGSGSGDGKTSGGDGSVVTMLDGTTFTYSNPLGGYWVYDPNDPFNNNARCNNFTPPLNTSWTWGVDKVYGVNLGGLFVLEPFISPSLFQKYQNLSFVVEDEWTLSLAMANDSASGGLQGQLEVHYDTFITEEDIAQIAGAGLNWIRVPIPFWAIDTWEGEPFLEGVSWKYIVRLLTWARKYGLRVNLDLHTAPGSQNGYNHSGKDGQVNFLRGVMGYANAERMLGYIRIITEFISQEEWVMVVPMFGIVNEALESAIGKDELTRFYLQAHDMIRSITGFGEGHGPYISIHDGFQGTASWANFLPGSDRINLDTHPYFAFDGQPNDDPIDTWGLRACNGWGPGINQSQVDFGVTIAGEFSNGYNDCAFFLNGVTDPHNGVDCAFWEDSTQWNQTIKDGLKNYALASMDALQNWFFWTWKIGNSSTTNTVQAPMWSYKAGLEGGWMPTDPREAIGVCASLGASLNPFDETYSAWQTGGTGAGTIDPTVRASFSQWPPPSMSGLPTQGLVFPFTDTAAQVVITNPVQLLPSYTQTAAIETLTPPPLSDFVPPSGAPKVTTSVSQGDGWVDGSDTVGGWTTVAGCVYPDAWDSVGVVLPTTVCLGGGAVAAHTQTSTPTPIPTLSAR